MNEFCLEKKIYYHDTDSGGVVYYANYLKYLEEARSEYCLDKGISLKELASNGIYFVVARVEVDYKLPARYQDTLRVLTKIQKIGRSSIDFLQRVFKESQLVLEAKTAWVCVNAGFKPRRTPEEIRHALSKE